VALVNYDPVKLGLGLQCIKITLKVLGEYGLWRHKDQSGMPDYLIRSPLCRGDVHLLRTVKKIALESDQWDNNHSHPRWAAGSWQLEQQTLATAGGQDCYYWALVMHDSRQNLVLAWFKDGRSVKKPIQRETDQPSAVASTG
jgi:hypothetical protein